MKNILVSVLVLTIVFVCIFFFLSFAWVGAEHVIEHDVNFGTVDRIVTFVMTANILNWFARTNNPAVKIKANPENDVKVVKKNDG